MRKSSFKKEYIKQAEKLAMLGLPQKDMAMFFGVDEDTITNWKKTFPEFSDALKKGEINRKMSLMKLIWESARNGNITMQIFLAKNWLGMKDHFETTLVPDGIQPLKIEFKKAEECKR